MELLYVVKSVHVVRICASDLQMVFGGWFLLQLLASQVSLDIYYMECLDIYYNGCS